jgi:hypothetical protein
MADPPSSAPVTLGGREDSKQLLNEFLATGICELVTSTLETGDVDSERLLHAERLYRLRVLADAMEKPPRRKIWPWFAAFFVTLFLSSILLFVRVPSTTVAINATVSALSVHSNREQILNRPLRVQSLGLTPLQEVWIGGEPITRFSRIESDGHALRIGTVDDTSRTTTARIVVPSFVLGRDDTAVLRGESDVLRMSIYGVVRTYNISGRGRAEIVTNTGYRDTLDMGRISPIEVGCCTGMPLVVSFPPPLGDTLPSNAFSEGLDVDSLSFTYQDQLADQELNASRLESGVVTAEVSYASLLNKTEKLGRGDYLWLRRAEGPVRVELVGGKLRIAFYGTVEGMETGEYSNRRSLMPTLVEWLQAQHGVWLLWGVGTYLVSLLSALILWWRKH